MHSLNVCCTVSGRDGCWPGSLSLSTRDLRCNAEASQHYGRLQAVSGLASLVELKLTSCLRVQRHAFRARPTLDIAGTATGSSLGAAGHTAFGPGPAAGPAAEDEQSLTWTSGMGRSRHGFRPLADHSVEEFACARAPHMLALNPVQVSVACQQRQWSSWQ